ncbi:hypothetical protein [Isoptericola sp. NPDC019482]|uniref:hypothetical protein n=1 Tax=Isoptericola sp. NPDC019482 TaxID=3154688 RepID=UPI00346C9D8A
MRIDLTGRTTLVPGPTQAIGLAVARGLASAGAQVWIDGRSQASAARALDELARDVEGFEGASTVSSATTVGAVRVDDGYVGSVLP